MNDEVQIGYCGVCCNHCGMRKRIPQMAEELKRFVKAYNYGEWIAHVTQEFNFQNFAKGLEWFANSRCNGCLREGGMPACEIRSCSRQKNLRNCYFCSDFLKCEKLEYQKGTYKINENHSKIRQMGYESWLKEQEDKITKCFDNIWYLEKKNTK